MAATLESSAYGVIGFVALLRGINLGRRTVRMDALREVFEAQGFKSVKTLLASGNVIFQAKDANVAKLRAKIEDALQKAFGFQVHVILRSAKEIQALVDSEPFKGVRVTPQTRLYLTFLSETPKSPGKIIGRGYAMREATAGHLACALSPKQSTPDYMDTLSKRYGEELTTRNWNTVMKIHAAMQGK
ncbi:MAG: DUF1697 domain-containing protein [Anaerolineales bacterium]